MSHLPPQTEFDLDSHEGKENPENFIVKSISEEWLRPWILDQCR